MSNYRAGESNTAPGRSRRGRGRRPRSGGNGGNNARDSRKGGKSEFPDDEPLEDEIDEGDPDAESVHVNDLKSKTPQELTEFGEELEIENAAGLRKQDLIFEDPEGTDRQEGAHLRRRHARDPARRLRLPACSGPELPGRARRHLRLTVPDPAFQPADRRHGARADSPAQGRRTVFRTAQGQLDQSRVARERSTQDPVRQSDTALSRGPFRSRGTEGWDHDAYHRPDRADREGPARAHHVAPEGRQDDDPEGHRERDRGEPPGSRADRAADRRAPGRSDRHAADREGRGHFLDLRRARDTPRAGRRHGDREGQAPGGARRDVVILLDSITRLARAHNTVVPHSGKILSGGVDSNALHKPETFLRRGAQHRRGRQPDDHRHRAGRDR